MRKKTLLKKTSFRKLTRTSYLALFLLLSVLSADSAYGIRLTKVKHLFDITHNFSQPSDVSVSKKGLIHVVDGVNNKIKVFDQSGRFLYSFGKKGSGKGRFNYPLGIDISPSGKIYIADSGNHRVQIFNPAGSYLAEIKIPSDSGNPSDPTDVSVDESNNRLYVVDNNNHYILAYELSTLKLTDTYGSAGMDKLEFRYPFFMTLDKDKYLYVVDVINTRIQVISPRGKFVSIIGGWGIEKGEFFRPKGVAIDKNNRLYASDSYIGVIQVFKLNGDFYSAVGDPETGGVKKFKSPVGIFIDGENRLYVVEMFADKVGAYSIEGDTE